MSAAPSRSRVSLPSAPNTNYATLYEFYQQGELTDATIFIEGTAIKVHKIVLASKSEIFRAMFKTAMLKGRFNQVYIEDVELKVFQEFLDYMYLGRCSNMRESPIKLLICAEKFGVESLSKYCELYIAKVATTKNVVKYLKIAHLYNRANLKRIMMDYLWSDARNALTADNWNLVAGNFDLMTELLLSYPCERKIAEVVEVPPGTLDSEVTLHWTVDFPQQLPSNLRSPKLLVLIEGELLEIRFVINRDVHLTKFHIAIETANFRAPLALNAILQLSNCNLSLEPIFVKKVFVWSRSDAESFPGSSERKKMALVMKQSEIYEQLARCLDNRVQWSLTLPTTETERIVGRATPTVRQPFIFRDYLKSAEFSDVTFVVEDVQFPAHRIVLAAMSPDFVDIFDKWETGQHVTLHTFSAKDFDLVLTYIYRRSLPFMVDVTVGLLYAAQLFSLPKLYSHCETHLLQQLNISSAVFLYLCGHELEAPNMKETAKRFITQNVKAVASTVSWKNLAKSPKLVAEIIQEII